MVTLSHVPFHVTLNKWELRETKGFFSLGRFAFPFRFRFLN